MASRRFAGLVLAVAWASTACVAGVRSRPAPAGSADGARFCPPRWVAEGDPSAPEASSCRAAIAADLPEGAAPRLPDRSARVTRGCPLRLPLTIEPGRCYLYAAQILPRSGPPRAAVRYPDPGVETDLVHLLDHGMAETFGAGADPLCFHDRIEAVVELSTEGEGDLVWLQVWEVSPDEATRWSADRRARLVAAALRSPASEPESDAEPGVDDPPPEPEGEETDGDGDASEELGGEPSASEAAEGAPHAGSDAAPADAAPSNPVPRTAEAEVLPASIPVEALPLGPLAHEPPDRCRNGEDDDGDGRADCRDPDCAALCPGTSPSRMPWGRVLDLRLGAAGRISHLPRPGGLAGIEASEPLVASYAPLAARGGLSAGASAVYRPSRFLGVGLDLDVGWLSLAADPPDPMPRASEVRVSALAVALGLSLQVSVPVSIVELGGAVGLGWLVVATTGETRSLSGADNAWVDEPSARRATHHAHATGRLWLDFWIVDGFALGLYGGLVAPLSAVSGLPANDYHAGLRTTLRLTL